MNILSIYESPNSIYKTQYFSIIDFYRKNPIQKHSIYECFKNPELYSEIHPIIPKWYYRNNKIKIDNSESNTIRIPYKVHIKLHCLLVSHFKTVNDTINYEKALNAICIFKGIFNNKKVHKIQIYVALSDQQIIEMLDLFDEYQKANKYKDKHQKKFFIHNRITNRNKVVPLGTKIEGDWIIGRYVSPQEHDRYVKLGKQLSSKYNGKTSTTKGKIRISNIKTGETKFVSKIIATDYLAAGWIKGCIFTDQHIEKIRKFNNSRKNKQTIGTLNKISITNGYDNMYISIKMLKFQMVGKKV